jgi:hypothetical protein
VLPPEDQIALSCPTPGKTNQFQNPSLFKIAQVPLGKSEKTILLVGAASLAIVENGRSHQLAPFVRQKPRSMDK